MAEYVIYYSRHGKCSCCTVNTNRQKYGQKTLYLYNNGDNTSVTGGWKTKNNIYGAGYEGATFTLDEVVDGVKTQRVRNAHSNTGNGFETVNKIDITAYDTLNVHYLKSTWNTDTEHNYKPMYNIQVYNKNGERIGSDMDTNLSSTDHTFSSDISNYMGECGFRVGSACNPNTVINTWVDKIWLEGHGWEDM